MCETVESMKFLEIIWQICVVFKTVWKKQRSKIVGDVKKMLGLSSLAWNRSFLTEDILKCHFGCQKVINDLSFSALILYMVRLEQLTETEPLLFILLPTPVFAVQLAYFCRIWAVTNVGKGIIVVQGSKNKSNFFREKRNMLWSIPKFVKTWLMNFKISLAHCLTDLQTKHV